MRTIIIITFFLALSACATGFDRVTDKVHKIALFEVENPENYAFIEDSKVSEGLIGLVQGLLKVKAEQQNAKVVEKIVLEYGFHFGRQMTQALERNLQQAGYEVIIIPKAQKDSVSVDAYLEVEPKAVGYIYFKAKEYIPWINVEVTFTGAKNGKTFYFEELNYGPDGATLIAKSRYTLKGDNVSLLFLNNKKRVIETLQVGTAALAEQISINLSN